MAIQTFTAGQILTAAQMNTLQTTVATYNAIGYRSATLSVTTINNDDIIDNTNFTGTIKAAVGDLIQATFTTTIIVGTNVAHFNFCTFNGATAVNRFIATPNFNPFFYSASFVGAAMMVAQYKVVAGDIFSNQVTVKLTGNTAGASRQIVPSDIPAQFTLTNLGQIQ